MDFDIENCTSKDELETYVQQTFGVDIDKRKKMDQLRKEALALTNKVGLQKTAQPDHTEAPTTYIGDVDIPVLAPKYVRNKFGVVFKKTKHIEKWMRCGTSGLADCDAQGNLV